MKTCFSKFELIWLLSLVCAAELCCRAVDQAPVSGESEKATVLKFSRPAQITHPFLPLSSLKQDILEGRVNGKKARLERSALATAPKMFKIGGQSVESVAIEDRTFEDGKLSVVIVRYFAQEDQGGVFCLGEDVTRYENGKAAGRQGSWMLGKDTQVPGMVLPGNPKARIRFQARSVSRETSEEDEIVSLAETVTLQSGILKDCLQVKQTMADGTIAHKYFARGIGIVRETPTDGDLRLILHVRKDLKPQSVASNNNSKTPQASNQASTTPPGKSLRDPLARQALAYVGVDPEAEAYWFEAINDATLSSHERQDLIEDLNEDGLEDPKHPAPGELPLILRRLAIIEELAPFAMDETNADAFREAYKDLVNLAALALGGGEPVK